MLFGSWYTKMTHSEVKKTVLRVFLVLALCLFMVRGTIHSNGLSRNGYVSLCFFFFFFALVILAYLYKRIKGAIRLPAACLYYLPTVLFPNLPQVALETDTR